MAATLTERIAARVLAQSSAPQSQLNRAVFLGVRNEVQRALDDGWSVLAVYRTLHADGRIAFSYQAFRRYVNTLIARKPNVPKR
ncbi:TraK family protein [Paraburkholderia sp. J63]|uniref:TraK family protein n=1 Tax=Paraburkholderia sp. J63 TaxID=2805434 RepID=UPI002ABE9BDC|nr:TraK family protein [Paraburkholderia sp. J63]